MYCLTKTHITTLIHSIFVWKEFIEIDNEQESVTEVSLVTSDPTEPPADLAPPQVPGEVQKV